MAYEIVGETIKSATSIKIGEIFKVATGQVDDKGNPIYTYPKRYKENVTKQTYPNFHIIQVLLTPTPKGIGNGRVQLEYLVNVQYRVAENTETISNLQQRLDEVGLKLCAELTELDLERPTKIYNSYYEKADGVLQFFFNIKVFAIPQKPEEQKMRILEQEINLKEEN